MATPTPIHDFLKQYAESGFERCHTPGHKGLFPPDAVAKTTSPVFDITEVNGQSIEIIRQSERIAADLFGAKRTLFSCSGSTLAISAMLTPFANRRIAAVRGVHRSVIDAAILLNIDIDWLYPDSPLKIAPETTAVLTTSIDYYGSREPRLAKPNLNSDELPKPDLSAFADLPVPLLVDNAHGAYTVLTQTHPLKLGAVMTAESAHKTLPALTGAAYLHISRDCPAEYAKIAENAM
ncbi:MAG: hypothetical protein FWF82_00115, partial [Oscillospiraceae bacterium]|nr:hypothetical protein [Oscillospiraceae bacterium]